MKLTVVDATGSPAQVHVPRDATVADLKLNLHDYCGVPLDMQELRHRGEVVRDEAALVELRGGDQLAYELDGGGNAGCQCGDCQLAVKVLCFSASCGGEWMKQQCFCCKMQCVVM